VAQRHTEGEGGGGGKGGGGGGGGGGGKTAVGSRRRLPPKHLELSKGAPLRLPQPCSDPIRVRVCSCTLCILTVCGVDTSIVVACECIACSLRLACSH